MEQYSPNININVAYVLGFITSPKSQIDLTPTVAFWKVK